MYCTTRHLLSLNFRWGFRGLDEEFEGQSMLISDWGMYMRFEMYMYQKRTYQGNENWTDIRVRVWGTKIEQGEQKCKVKQKLETKWSSETWNTWGSRIWGWINLLWAEMGTKSIPRCWMFSEDLASAYVLHHQTPIVLKFWMWVQSFGLWVWGTINVDFRLRNIHEVWNVYISKGGISG